MVTCLRNILNVSSLVFVKQIFVILNVFGIHKVILFFVVGIYFALTLLFFRQGVKFTIFDYTYFALITVGPMMFCHGNV